MQWENHPVTKALKGAIQERIDEAKDALVNSSDEEFDRFVKGMIRAFREVQAMEVTPLEEGEDEVSA